MASLSAEQNSLSLNLRVNCRKGWRNEKSSKQELKESKKNDLAWSNDFKCMELKQRSLAKENISRNRSSWKRKPSSSIPQLSCRSVLLGKNTVVYQSTPSNQYTRFPILAPFPKSLLNTDAGYLF